MKASTKRRGQRLLKKWNKKSHEVSVKSTEHLKENLIEKLPQARNIRLLIVEWSLLVLALIFLACAQAFWYQNSYSNETFTNGGTYTEGTLGKIQSFNPLFSNTNSEDVVSHLLFATLTTTDYTGHTNGDLAQSVTSDESAKTWTVRLRDNLKWSDGEPLTNEDVIFTAGLIQNPAVKTIYTSNLSGVKVAEEDGSIVFRLPSAYKDFDSVLDIPILPKHILKDITPAQLADADFNNNPVTSGPFKFNASQTSAVSANGERVAYLTANPSYYKGKPMLDTFAVHAYENLGALKDALKSGAINATAELTSKDAKDVLTGDIQEKQTALNSGVFAFFNVTNPSVSNKTVRQAIRQGVNMNNLREILNGEAPLDYPVLESQITLSNWPELPKYDAATARTTLQQAGASTDVPLQIATVSTGYLPDLANRFAAQLQNLGLKTEVSVYEPDQNFVSSVLRQRNYDILIDEIDLGIAPDLFAYYHSSQANSSGLNLSNYSNAIADDALIAVRSASTDQRRALKYENFLKVWSDDVPAIGIYQPNLSYFMNKTLRSFSENNRLIDKLDRFEDVRFWASVQTSKHRTP